MNRLRAAGLEVIVHTILGLPGEDQERMFETLHYLNDQDIQGIKLQLLHILKGTDLAVRYEEDPFHVFTMEEYVKLIPACVEILRPDLVIHRLTGDGPRRLLLAPLWSTDKKRLLNTINRQLVQRDLWQGKYYRNEETHG